MQITSTTLENVRVSDTRRGQASVVLANAESDPLAELIEVRDVLGGIHFLLDCDLPLGEVIHDYLASKETTTLAPMRVA